MLARELFDIRSILRKQGIIFAYSGAVTETVLSGVGEAIKQKLLIDRHEQGGASRAVQGAAPG